MASCKFLGLMRKFDFELDRQLKNECIRFWHELTIPHEASSLRPPSLKSRELVGDLRRYYFHLRHAYCVLLGSSMSRVQCCQTRMKSCKRHRREDALSPRTSIVWRMRPLLINVDRQQSVVKCSFLRKTLQKKLCAREFKEL